MIQRLLPFAALVAACLAVTTTFADESPMSKQDAGSLRVMTFNIRYNNPGDGENAWPHRRDWVAEIVRDQRIDVVGMQEARVEQIADLEQRLPEYAWFGVGRDDGQRGGEHTPIFYRKDRFERLDEGAFWLSKNPDQPGSKNWDSAITRVTAWLKLKDRQTGAVFFMFNTHFDHLGILARRESAKLHVRKIPEIAGSSPVVLTGDFNCKPGTAPYETLTSEPAAQGGFQLRDARAVSQTEPQGPDTTWNGFKRIQPNRRIDFLFVTPGVQVLSHATLDDTRDGRFPSDHLPVMAELQLPKAP